MLLFSGIIACNNVEPVSKKSNFSENNFSTQNDKSKTVTNESIIVLDTTKKVTSAVSLESEQTINKEKKQPEVSDLLTESVQVKEKNHIIPGFVRNTFTKVGNIYSFNRIVKQNEDSRLDGSGGQNELSFTLINPADTFLLENEMLKSLNFKYLIQGEIYTELGENPFTGKIKGILLPDNIWQIEMNVWIKMTDLQLNIERERQIIINDKFIL